MSFQPDSPLMILLDWLGPMGWLVSLLGLWLLWLIPRSRGDPEGRARRQIMWIGIVALGVCVLVPFIEILGQRYFGLRIARISTLPQRCTLRAMLGLVVALIAAAAHGSRGLRLAVAAGATLTLVASYLYFIETQHRPVSPLRVSWQRYRDWSFGGMIASATVAVLAFAMARPRVTWPRVVLFAVILACAGTWASPWVRARTYLSMGQLELATELHIPREGGEETTAEAGAWDLELLLAILESDHSGTLLHWIKTQPPHLLERASLLVIQVPELDEEMLERLVHLTTAEDSSVRRVGASLLARRPPAEIHSVADRLLPLLASEDEFTHILIIRAYLRAGRMDDESTRLAVVASLAETAEHHDVRQLRLAATHGLGRLARDTDDVMFALERLMRGKPDNFTQAAEFAWRRIHEPQKGFGLLASILRGELGDEVRHLGTWEALDLGPAAAPVLPELMEIARADDSPLAGAALRSIRLMGPAAEAAIPLFEELSRGDTENARLARSTLDAHWLEPIPME